VGVIIKATSFRLQAASLRPGALSYNESKFWTLIQILWLSVSQIKNNSLKKSWFGGLPFGYFGD
jgi:hypothetical protein